MFLGPFIPTPFTDLFAIITPNYRVALRNDLCAKIQMRFANCLEAYGNKKAEEKCMDLFYDIFECQHGKIQVQRVIEIQKERKRQYKAGKIKELHSEKPPLESYFHINS